MSISSRIRLVPLVILLSIVAPAATVRHSVGERGLAHAVNLAAAASATGYGVLALSDLNIIRDFGMLLAVTVACALVTARAVVWLGLADTSSAAAPAAQLDTPSTSRQLVGADR